jgi:hypothetical protein
LQVDWTGFSPSFAGSAGHHGRNLAGLMDVGYKVVGYLIAVVTFLQITAVTPLWYHISPTHGVTTVTFVWVRHHGKATYQYRRQYLTKCCVVVHRRTPRPAGD